jgi:hypothetical protein
MPINVAPTSTSDDVTSTTATELVLGCRPEKIDRPPLAVDRKGDLDLCQPSIPAEDPDRRIDDAGMALVDEPVEGFTSPSEIQVETAIQRVGSGLEGTPWDPRRLATLDPTKDAPRQAGAIGELLLRPPLPPTQGDHRPSEPPTIHIKDRRR